MIEQPDEDKPGRNEYPYADSESYLRRTSKTMGSDPLSPEEAAAQIERECFLLYGIPVRGGIANVSFDHKKATRIIRQCFDVA